eukprot:gene5392-6725_t
MEESIAVSLYSRWNALEYDIELPFHMVFRSSSLISTVVIGSLFWRKKYTLKQIISLLMVTCGIIIATFNSMPENKREFTIKNAEQGGVYKFVTGITMLTIAMFLSSVLGLIQEFTYKKHGKDCHRETIFYTHLFSIPFSVFIFNDIVNQVKITNQSPLLNLPIVGLVPSLWFYLLINVITQFICIQGVFILTGKTSTLTCTLVISLRKFLSIIISVVYFKNPFTLTLWISTFMVLVGTFIYSDPFAAKKKKEE